MSAVSFSTKRGGMVRPIGLCAISFVMFWGKELFIPRMLLCFGDRIDDRKQRTEDRKQTTDGRGQMTDDREQRSKGEGASENRARARERK